MAGPGKTPSDTVVVWELCVDMELDPPSWRSRGRQEFHLLAAARMITKRGESVLSRKAATGIANRDELKVSALSPSEARTYNDIGRARGMTRY